MKNNIESDFQPIGNPKSGSASAQVSMSQRSNRRGTCRYRIYGASSQAIERGQPSAAKGKISCFPLSLNIPFLHRLRGFPLAFSVSQARCFDVDDHALVMLRRCTLAAFQTPVFGAATSQMPIRRHSSFSQIIHQGQLYQRTIDVTGNAFDERSCGPVCRYFAIANQPIKCPNKRQLVSEIFRNC